MNQIKCDGIFVIMCASDFYKKENKNKCQLTLVIHGKIPVLSFSEKLQNA